MKRVIFLFISVIALLQVNAQVKSKIPIETENFFRFGVKAGLNVNKIQGKDYKEGFNYNYQLGAFLQFNITHRFGIQPEVSFVQTSTEFSDNLPDVYNDLFRDGSQKTAKLNYLEIPLLLNVNVGSSKRVKLQLGPCYGNVLSGQVDSLNAGKEVENVFKKGDVSAIGGLWIQLPLVHIGGRYKYGLTNINAVADGDKWRNQAIQVFIGLTF